MILASAVSSSAASDALKPFLFDWAALAVQRSRADTPRAARNFLMLLEVASSGVGRLPEVSN
eukprot:2366661-Alexandrium_andersonii.AAC.1